MESQKLTTGLKILSVAVNTGFIIAAVAILGYREGQGLWIFGSAWFPLLLYLVVDVITTLRLPDNPVRMGFTFLMPFLYMAIAMFVDGVPFANFVIQTAALIFTSAMLAFAIQATILPVVLKTRPDWSTFINEQVIPQAFGFIPGLLIGFWMISYIIANGALSNMTLILLGIGIVHNGVAMSVGLHKAHG